MAGKGGKSSSPDAGALSRRPGDRRKSSSPSSSSTYPSKMVTGVGAAAVVAVLSYIVYGVHDRYVVRPAIIATKSHLPTVIDADAYTLDREQLWGTYRSNLYFGMRTRSPNSPVVGLMWYEQPIQNVMLPTVRHWCDQNDAISRYGWTQHDGRRFGVQNIEDNQIVIKTEFAKRPTVGRHGGDWTARISAEPSIRVLPDANPVHSFIVYIALGDNSITSTLRPIISKTAPSDTIDIIHGSSSTLGDFTLRLSNATNLLARSFLITHIDPIPDMRQLQEVMIAGTGVRDIQSPHLTLHLALIGIQPSPQKDTVASPPNIVAIQITFLKSTTFDIIFESASASADRVDTLTGDVFTTEIDQLKRAFEDQFENAFGLKSKNYPDFYQSMGQYALSNMLGSIGYFYGSSKVQGIYNSEPVPYGPHQLFTAVPSRPFFPRGFLWDEGFHQLLIRKFDPNLSFEMVGSWLDLMNVDGWIPREMILGVDAEHRVPAEYVVQRDSIANPPMFFYLIGRSLDDRVFVDAHMDKLRRMYPRLKLWFDWLNRTQIGSERGTYRWRGRNATTDMELNPKTLPSGLDDYPRASHPTDDEYHLDLRCWMTVSARVLAKLANLVGDTVDRARLESSAAYLADTRLLDKLHWSEKSGRYCDYGLHTRNTKLVQPQPILGADGRLYAPVRNVWLRQITGQPTLRLVTDAFGYVSLFPLMLRLLPTDSTRIGVILDQLVDEQLLWTPYGLRSLAKSSPLYDQRNTEHDPPYWRGSIWINMNYLVLSALKHYASTAGPNQERAFTIYADLRNAIVSNVAREFKRTGYLWEHYNDATGNGEGTHPFTGWSSLVLLIMAEQYD